jgi:ABC-type transport system substrate-binding protein
LQELAAKQSQATDSNERRRLVTEFQQRMLDHAYFLPLFWGERTVVLPANLRGWRLLPNTVLNLDMGATWLEQ